MMSDLRKAIAEQLRLAETVYAHDGLNRYGWNPSVADTILATIKAHLPEEDTRKYAEHGADQGIQVGWNAYRNEILALLGESDNGNL